MKRSRRQADSRRSGDSSEPLPVRPAEKLLIDAIPEIEAALAWAGSAPRIACLSVGRAQFAAEAARRIENCRVTCLYLDLYHADQARQMHADLANLSIICQSDLPEETLDVFALPVLKNGEAELAREWIQQGLLRLRPGGGILSATDNPRDTWLHDELRALFPKVTRRPSEDGVLYLATKQGEPKKVRNFLAEFKFRDGDRLIEAVSRPGVFSHRRIDPGARALLECLDVAAGEKVFDIGCGAGVLSLAAALRAEGVRVFAVDSNPRAVECTGEGARRNGLANIEVRLDAEAACDEPGTFDLAMANPPYFSNYRIAEIFVRGALAALNPAGRLMIVTRQPAWFVERLTRTFREVTAVEVRHYAVIRAAGPNVDPGATYTQSAARARKGKRR